MSRSARLRLADIVRLRPPGPSSLLTSSGLDAAAALLGSQTRLRLAAAAPISPSERCVLPALPASTNTGTLMAMGFSIDLQRLKSRVIARSGPQVRDVAIRSNLEGSSDLREAAQIAASPRKLGSSQ